MIWISLVVFLLLAAGVILLFGLTPEDITNDVMRMLSPKKTLREKVLLAQGRKKSRRLTQEILHIRDALNATGKANSFSWVCAASVIMMVAGCIVSVMIGNLFLIPVAAVVFAAIPFAAAAKSIADYDKQVREELETALSIITTSYIRTDDTVNAVRENLSCAGLLKHLREVSMDIIIECSFRITGSNIRLTVERMLSILSRKKQAPFVIAVGWG